MSLKRKRGKAVREVVRQPEQPKIQTRRAKCKLIYVGIGGTYQSFTTESSVPFMPPSWGHYVSIEPLSFAATDQQAYYYSHKGTVHINPRYLVYWQEVEIDILVSNQ